MEWEGVSRILVFGLTIGCIYALTAVGLNLLWGTMRVINIAHGSLIMLGGYTAFWLFTLYNVSTFISAGLATIGGAILGLIVYRLLFSSSLKTIKSPEAIESFSLLIFFGVLILLQNVASLAWTGNFREYTYLTKTIMVLGTPVGLNRLLASLIAIGVSLGFYFYLQKALFGKAVRAVIQDNDASKLVGINISRIYMFCFGAGFAMAGLAGALLSMLYALNPYMGLPYTLIALVVIILGGMGNILGSLIGGLLLGLIITAAVSLTSPSIQFLILYLVFVLVILFMPAGIMGRRLRGHPKHGG